MRAWVTRTTRRINDRSRRGDTQLWAVLTLKGADERVKRYGRQSQASQARAAAHGHAEGRSIAMQAGQTQSAFAVGWIGLTPRDEPAARHSACCDRSRAGVEARGVKTSRSVECPRLTAQHPRTTRRASRPLDDDSPALRIRDRRHCSARSRLSTPSARTDGSGRRQQCAQRGRRVHDSAIRSPTPLAAPRAQLVVWRRGAGPPAAAVGAAVGRRRAGSAATSVGPALGRERRGPDRVVDPRAGSGGGASRQRAHSAPRDGPSNSQGPH